MPQTLKIGDAVKWRGGFGGDAPKIAKITEMQVTEFPREKYGDDVDEVDISLVRENRVNFVLDTGNWCYSDQIVLYAKGPTTRKNRANT